MQIINDKLDNIYNWQCNFYNDIPNKFPLIMTEKEQEILIKYIKQSKVFLEFGSGGSTFLSVIHGNCTIYSVESDK